MMVKKIVVGLALVGGFALVIALVGGSSSAQEQEQTTPPILFIQQDKVIRFNQLTGEGLQTGTSLGAINGVTIVNFKFSEAATGLPDATFDNRTGITDLDGDRIIFHTTGTARFIIEPLIDTTAPLTNQVFGASPIPCPGFGGACSGVGGPVQGTYEVVATSGKYVDLYPIGTKFPHRGLGYNPSSPPNDPDDVGSVYIEVYATPVQ